MIIILKDYISQFVKEGSFEDYTEVRGQNIKMMGVALTNGIMSSNYSNKSKGVSARVYKNGLYGFSSLPNYDEAGVKKVLNKAKENALFLNENLKPVNTSFDKTKAFSIEKGLEKEETRDQKYLSDFARKMDEHIKEKYPKLLSRMVNTQYQGIEKIYGNTYGSKAHTLIARSQCFINLSMMGTDGNPVSLYGVYGGGGSISEKLADPSKFYEDVERLYEDLSKKAEGIYASSGLKEVILHSSIAGLFAHEAVGHTTEADFVMSGSIASRFLNQKVASDLVTLVDCAHHDAWGRECPVPVYVDDEGIMAEDAVIIENGILKRYMHNRESAQKMGQIAQGNSRANEYYDEPLIRMRNTCILPGKSKLEDMIASMEDGYYFTKSSNGQADTTSEFMFGVCMGYEVKKGKIKRALKDTTISGVAFDVLKNVTQVSDELTWGAGGWCGKKQVIIVGMGGPAIKTKLNIGGR